jgi:hypothetical protein
MKSKGVCISTLIRFVIFSVAFSGCGPAQRAELGNGTAIHEDAPSKNICVVNVRSNQYDRELVISGDVRRECNFCYEDVIGHIDIAVLDSGGDVLGTASTFYSPPNIPKTGRRSSSFAVRLPVAVGEGAVIRTAYHEDSDFAVSSPDRETSHCRMNMALPDVQAAAVSRLNGR